MGCPESCYVGADTSHQAHRKGTSRQAVVAANWVLRDPRASAMAKRCARQTFSRRPVR